MPTTHTVNLPKPTDWDEFEKISLQACEILWSPTRLTRHGRRGQAQQGVDFYGNDNFDRLAGVQCKNTPAGISADTGKRVFARKYSFPAVLIAFHFWFSRSMVPSY